jgi:hypothetical protein
MDTAKYGPVAKATSFHRTYQTYPNTRITCGQVSLPNDKLSAPRGYTPPCFHAFLPSPTTPPFTHRFLHVVYMFKWPCRISPHRNLHL